MGKKIVIAILLIIIALLAVTIVWFGFFSGDRVYDVIKSETSKQNSQVHDIAMSLKANCRRSDNPTCYTAEIENYIANKAKKREKGWLEAYYYLGNDYNTTLEKGNNCVGLAVLAAGLMKELNMTGVYMLIQPSHTFIGYDTGKGMLFVYNDDTEIESIRMLW